MPRTLAKALLFVTVLLWYPDDRRLAHGFAARALRAPLDAYSSRRGRVRLGAKGKSRKARARAASSEVQASSSVIPLNGPLHSVTPLVDPLHLAEEQERHRERGSPLMIVKFYANHCRACQAIAKRYRKLAVSLGSQVRCYEMEQAAFRGHADSIGIHKLPAIHVYAGGEKVEDLVCGPSHFKEVRDLLANDLHCDPRSEDPCDLVYDDALGPIPDFSEVPAGYSTEYARSLSEELPVLITDSESESQSVARHVT